MSQPIDFYFEFASPYGYHVFKVLSRRAPRTRKFEDVKAEAERRATAEKRVQAERQLLQQVRDMALRSCVARYGT